MPPFFFAMYKDGTVNPRQVADHLVNISRKYSFTIDHAWLIALGYGARKMVDGITDLTGITPAIVEVLGKDDPCD